MPAPPSPENTPSDGPHLAAVVVTDLVARLDRDLGPMDADQRTDLNDGLRELSSALGWRLDADGRNIAD